GGLHRAAVAALEVVRPAGEGGLRCEADELGGGHGRVAANGGDELGEWDARGDAARVVERRSGSELEVEGDERGARADECRPRRRMDAPRAEIGRGAH